MKHRKGHAPLVHTHNPSTGHQVVVMGTSHVRSKKSWEDTSAELTKYLDVHGFNIHMEGLRPIPDGVTLTADEARLKDAMTGLMTFMDQTATTAGMVNQRQGLASILDRCVRSDLTWAEFAQASVREPHVMKRIGRLEWLNQMMDELDVKPEWKPNQGTLSRHLSKHVMRAVGMPLHTMLEARNDHAIKGAISDPKPVVLFWGSAHVPGMVKALAMHGYEPISTEWRSLGVLT